MLLDGRDAWQRLVEDIKSAKNQTLFIVSAYMRSEILRELTQYVHNSNRVRVGVRWEPRDLADGTSDLASFEVASEFGWELHSIPKLHAKVYALSEKNIFVGSANMTRRGFSLLGSQGNQELMTVIPASKLAITKIETLFENSILITNELYSKLLRWFESRPLDIETTLTADDYPIRHLVPLQPTRSIMVSDCPHTFPRDLLNNENYSSWEMKHDLKLLNLSPDKIDARSLSDAFQESIIYAWLIRQLQSSENKELFFGELTKRLHDALEDDPAPRRKQVKDLLQIILSWVDITSNDKITIDRPNHSQRIRLN